ncbi:Bug family tripartite tricarboxylate transporter substrate binding protein [Sinanaerobacter chloroacetimidivorans]|jgi:tripartite-type tricarboxylate transporter receptor subunit TctC|uniref:Tripartite tricarboxylate transporter substrate binding protein n=1 Tax=Sinanaerobacter chloroacetimidivorans TaxID=2818044 RepID=A0A8J7W0D8_9FIRM|nr:tripartite tricarboxylate transporter substrate binding protein [Sinanaerobacter chloroacetimidivorans]MBR0596881.1 tripartite tricarboxylate transporter substrate binding protein [Sinanaerobacter chloroacetimidivorans]
MKRTTKRLFSALLAFVLLMSVTACGANTAADGSAEEGSKSADGFPEKQVTIIMPWSLGGGPDTIARQIASYGEKYLGVPVIVENKTGGAGTIAMAAALQAADDGYSMIVANGPLFSLTPSFQNVNYSIDDITPLIGMREVEFVVLSNPGKSGIETLDQLKEYAASGKTIKYATTGGPGNDSYTMISVLFKRLGLPAEAVPYDGGQDAINALVGGHVDIAIGSPPVYRDYVKSGELACLGTFIPDGIEVDGIGRIPSFKEQGIDAEFIGMDYFAVRSTVDDAKKKVLTEFIQNVYADPDFQKFMSEMGMKAWDGTEVEILQKIDEQSKAMVDYITLLE